MNYEENIKREAVVAFPVPSLLTSIEELLYEVQWLEGLILVTESRRTSFVSISQLGGLLGRLRGHPKGSLLAEKICLTLSEANATGAAKPVLVLHRGGGFWLGVIGISGKTSEHHQTIAHLERCFEINT